ncbi:hypothetical protein E2C01_072667 [Portunus trituberculatus]|uniref:Secreted protein n=1 Tax=Portunus trituberculatus TaxID=210409 RepID=A0A5B7I7S4_PORTR|nr:hypothetical protein [Portunus trituberculatus]
MCTLPPSHFALLSTSLLALCRALASVPSPPSTAPFLSRPPPPHASEDSAKVVVDSSKGN